MYKYIYKVILNKNCNIPLYIRLYRYTIVQWIYIDITISINIYFYAVVQYVSYMDTCVRCESVTIVTDSNW